MPVTFEPMALLMIEVVPLPVLLMVPALLTDAPERVMTPVLFAVSVRLPVPVTPPLKVMLLATVVIVRFLLSVIGPLKMLAALSVMVLVPVLPDATEIALVNVPARPPLNVVLAEPLLSPIVIVPVPNALVLVVPLSVPALIMVPVE